MVFNRYMYGVLPGIYFAASLSLTTAFPSWCCAYGCLLCARCDLTMICRDDNVDRLEFITFMVEDENHKDPTDPTWGLRDDNAADNSHEGFSHRAEFRRRPSMRLEDHMPTSVSIAGQLYAIVYCMRSIQPKQIQEKRKLNFYHTVNCRWQGS
jgi:hypothetical protein